MDFFVHAQKFLQSARRAHSPEVIETDLAIADWLLSRGIEEQGNSGPSDRGSASREPQDRGSAAERT
jgi:hypothetical protein